MKMQQKFIAAMLTGIVLMLNVCTGASAINVHELNPEPPSMSEIQPFGAKPPTSSTGTHSLKTDGKYSYTVTEVGAQVYTDRWLTGADEIDVSVNGFERVDGSPLQVYDNVGVIVYDEKGKKVDSAMLDCYENPDGGVLTVSTPGSGKKFYVCFTVKHTDCKFKFFGWISKA